MGMTPSAHKRHQLERIRRKREALGEIDRRPAKPSWWSEPRRRLPTLGELNRSAPHWLWLHCTDYICTHSGALPLAPLIIRWGEDTPISWLQSQPRCSVCGTKGAQTIHPSVGSLEGLMWQPFPPERRAMFCYVDELERPMCNLYSMTKNQAAIIALTRAMRDTTGNLPTLPGIFPDYMAPIVRNAPDGVRELMMGRWGMPGPPQFGSGAITNIRNTKSAHWRAWLKLARRCVVPWTSFCEYADTKPRKTPTWFAFDEARPLAVFAGIWTTWRGKRGTMANPVEGEHTLFGILTTDANDVVGAIHPKAMPVILTKPEEIETWMTGPVEEALNLQRPLPDGLLKIVATGEREDKAF